MCHHFEFPCDWIQIKDGIICIPVPIVVNSNVARDP